MSFLLSIICPTYNRSLLLQECIQSILSRTNVSLEVIIVDDGSNDDTPSVCAKLLNSYGVERVVINRLAANSGAQVARNRGLRVARGEFVMFVDSDDVVVSDGIEALAETLKANLALDYAYGVVIRTDERLEPLVQNSSVGELFSNAPIDLAGYHWHTMGALYRTSYLKKVGPWNEALTGSQDWEYQARVKLAGGQCKFVDKVVGYWRQHCNSRVGTKSFRPDYVKSVIATCLSIASHARANYKYDRALAHKLAGRMFRHGLEFSVHDYPAEARHVFREVSQLPGLSPYVRVLVSAFNLSPKMLNRRIYETICAYR